MAGGGGGEGGLKKTRKKNTLKMRPGRPREREKKIALKTQISP